MDCENREGISYLQLHRGNNILHAESNCLVKDEGISPEFSFRTPANNKDIKFEITKVEATFIDPNRAEINDGINKEKIELDKLKNL